MNKKIICGIVFFLLMALSVFAEEGTTPQSYVEITEDFDWTKADYTNVNPEDINSNLAKIELAGRLSEVPESAWTSTKKVDTGEKDADGNSIQEDKNVVDQNKIGDPKKIPAQYYDPTQLNEEKLILGTKEQIENSLGVHPNLAKTDPKTLNQVFKGDKFNADIDFTKANPDAKITFNEETGILSVGDGKTTFNPKNFPRSDVRLNVIGDEVHVYDIRSHSERITGGYDAGRKEDYTAVIEGGDITYSRDDLFTVTQKNGEQVKVTGNFFGGVNLNNGDTLEVSTFTKGGFTAGANGDYTLRDGSVSKDGFVISTDGFVEKKGNAYFAENGPVTYTDGKDIRVKSGGEPLVIMDGAGEIPVDFKAKTNNFVRYDTPNNFIETEGKIGIVEFGDLKEYGDPEYKITSNSANSKFRLEKGLTLAKGKIGVEDSRGKIELLTDSSQYLRRFVGDKEQVSITADQDTGEIAKFSRKYKVGDVGITSLVGKDAFTLDGNLNVETVIEKDTSGKYNIKVDQNSQLTKIMNDPKKIALMDRNLELTAGDATLTMSKGGGMIYEQEGKNTVTYLEPTKVHQLVGGPVINVNEEITSLNQRIDAANNINSVPLIEKKAELKNQIADLDRAIELAEKTGERAYAGDLAKQKLALQEQIGQIDTQLASVKELTTTRDSWKFMVHHDNIQGSLDIREDLETKNYKEADLKYKHAISQTEAFLKNNADSPIAEDIKMSLAEMYTTKAAMRQGFDPQKGDEWIHPNGEKLTIKEIKDGTIHFEETTGTIGVETLRNFKNTKDVKWLSVTAENTKADYTKAINTYEDVLKNNPKNTDARFNLAGNYLQVGNNKARSEFETLLRKDAANIQTEINKLDQQIKNIPSGTTAFAPGQDMASLLERKTLLENQKKAIETQAYTGLSIYSSDIRNDLDDVLHYSNKALEVDPNNAAAKQIQLNTQKVILNGVNHALSNEAAFVRDAAERKLGIQNFEGSFWQQAGQVVDNTGILIASHFGYAEDITTVMDGLNNDLLTQQTGLGLLKLANEKGYSIQDIYDSTSAERIDIVRGLAKEYPNQFPKTMSDREAIVYSSSIAQAFTNQDIKLALQHGRLTDSQLDRYQAAEFGSAEEQRLVWNRFRFPAGSGYVSKGAGLDYTWRDTLFQGADIKNAALFLAPGAQLGRLGQVGTLSRLGMTAETTLAGALVRSTALGGKAIIGTERATQFGEAAIGLKHTLASSKIGQFLGQSYGSGGLIDKSITGFGRFGFAEAAETFAAESIGVGLGFVDPEVAKAASLYTGIITGHAGVFDNALGGTKSALKNIEYDEALDSFNVLRKTADDQINRINDQVRIMEEFGFHPNAVGGVKSELKTWDRLKLEIDQQETVIKSNIAKEFDSNNFEIRSFTKGHPVDGAVKGTDVSLNADRINIQNLPNGGRRITLSDQTGHGLEGSTEAIKLIDDNAKRSLTKDNLNKLSDSLGDVVGKGKFSTHVGVEISPTGNMKVANQGERVVVVSKDGSITPIDATGSVLGVKVGTTKVQPLRKELTNVQLKDGDSVILMSDGIFETLYDSRKRFPQQADELLTGIQKKNGVYSKSDLAKLQDNFYKMLAKHDDPQGFLDQLAKKVQSGKGSDVTGDDFSFIRVVYKEK